MWGTHSRQILQVGQKRFIPTDVGNSNQPWHNGTWKPVHPHGCGELKLPEALAVVVSGSSPRMWGTLFDGINIIKNNRFIPTDVGNSNLRRAYPALRAVHPHGCGELGSCFCFIGRWNGSSPRMWGTRLRSSDPNPQPRFIPTDVGNSCPGSFVGSAAAVHPHGCGELGCLPFFSSPTGGSSPRMWGTHVIRCSRSV